MTPRASGCAFGVDGRLRTHAKFIGCGSDATGLFEATGLDVGADAGMIEIADDAAIEPSLSRCRELRFGDRPV